MQREQWAALRHQPVIVTLADGSQLAWVTACQQPVPYLAALQLWMVSARCCGQIGTKTSMSCARESTVCTDRGHRPLDSPRKTIAG